MNAPKKTTATALLGLVLDGSRLDVVAVKRTNGSVEVRHSASATLTLDPLTNEPDLVGAEIQTHLEKAGVRDRRCVVGVPLNWALTLSVKVPAGLAPEDVQSLLAMEAERGFPYAPETLMVAPSLVGPADGERTATLVAIPRDHITRLRDALESIGLRPLSFSLGLAALQPVAESDTAGGVVALQPGEKGVSLQVTAQSGVAALRLLEGAIAQEGPERRVQKDYVGRELRITLGQLPDDARGAVRNLKVFGNDELAEELYEQIRPRAEALGLRAQLVKEFAPLEFGPALPNGTAASAALALAVRHLAGKPVGFEFLPPRLSKWQQFTQQHASRKLVYAAAVFGVALLAVAGLFGWQQWRLTKLETQWKGMETRVTQIKDMEGKIRKYRPWYDESFRALSILKAITQAFPEDGGVAAKSVEIRDRSGVTVSGTARNNAALLKMRDLLSASKHVTDVKVEHVKGGQNNQPLEFTFNFHWADSTPTAR
jgi:Tfp pilus assembly protein PilN